MLKKFIISVSIILSALIIVGASQDSGGQNMYSYQMNGTWLPDVHPLHVGANNYTVYRNQRPTQTGHETVEGYSKINTTLIDTPINLHYFSKTNESHIIAKVNNSGTYELYENITAIPGTGDFSATALYSGLASNSGSFVNGPRGTMFYADGSKNLVWGGNEIYPEIFLQGDDLVDTKDFTNKINNNIQSEYVGVGDEIDSYTVALLHMDGTDGGTTFTDSSTSGHTFTASGDAQTDTDYYVFGGAAGLFDGTGDYVYSSDNTDWELGSGDFTVNLKFRSAATTIQPFCGRYIDAGNYWFIGINYATNEFLVLQKVSGAYTINIQESMSESVSNGIFYDFEIVRNGSTFTLYKNGKNVASSTSAVALSDWAVNFTVGAGFTYRLNGSLDEFMLSKGIARHTSDFTPRTTAFTTWPDYFYIMSPFKLDGVKIYILKANLVTSTLSVDVWSGETFSSLSITDNTASGGITLAQTGTVTWEYSEDPSPYYVNGRVLYVYRLSFSAGSARIYQITDSVPLQPIRDIWNEVPRTCISFQVHDGAIDEDYTFQVNEKDSATGSLYAADIGGLTNADYIIAIFDDRAMGIKFDLVSANVNQALNTIADIKYFDGSAFTSVGSFIDGTLNDAGNESFAKSGVVVWNPPPKDDEHLVELYGVSGYAYKITLATAVALTADTSIDYSAGISAPLNISGYDLVGYYNGRVMLIKGSHVDYSQTDTPWVFNGIDSSNDSRLSLYFGDDNPIVATKSIFNRYGSNLIESWSVIKKNSTYLLSGVQPYLEYSEPFIIKTISDNIGCAAPMTVQSFIMDIGDGISMNILSWLDYSGPVAFNGASIEKIPGIENYFDPSNSECVNYGYIENSISYVDTVHNQINFLFPTGASTSNNKWVVYDYKLKKWFEKVPTTYPTMATHVVDTNGARYNYGTLSTGQMLRLDHNQTWDGTAISWNMTTGYFTPAMADDKFGMWYRSIIRGIRVLSADTTEDLDLTVQIYNDGVLSSNSLTIPLDVSGIVSKNSVNSGNMAEQADYYQVKFSGSSSSSKWEGLAWGYAADMKRRD